MMKIISAAAILFASVEGKMLKTNQQGLEGDFKKSAEISAKSLLPTGAGFVAGHLGEFLANFTGNFNETAKEYFPIMGEIAAIAGTDYAVFIKQGGLDKPAVWIAISAAWASFLIKNFANPVEQSDEDKKKTGLDKVIADLQPMAMFALGQFVIVMVASVVLGAF